MHYSLDWKFISIESMIVLHRQSFCIGPHLRWFSCILLAIIGSIGYIQTSINTLSSNPENHSFASSINHQIETSTLPVTALKSS